MKDVIIIGAGRAGLAAGIQCKSAGLDAVLIEGISARQHCEFPNAVGFGLEVEFDELRSLSIESAVKKAVLSSGEIEATTIILAMGATPRKLDLENENRLRGRGVSYCVPHNLDDYEGKKILVAGGGPDALENIVKISQFSSIFWGVHTEDEFQGPESLIEEALTCGALYMIWDSTITRIVGEDKLDGVYMKNTKLGMETYMHVDRLLVSVGSVPNSGLMKGTPILDKSGFIMTDEKMCTSINGVFAAGKIRQKQKDNRTLSEADGAAAAKAALQYLS